MTILEEIKGERLSSVKGILICLIVMGHNSALFVGMPQLSHLYLFHVQSFLILGVVLNTHVFSGVFIRERAARYLIPFVIFTMGYTVLNTLLSGGGVLAFLHAVFLSISTGRFVTLDAYAGLAMLWFLPALFSIILLHSLYLSENLLSRGVVIGLSIVVPITISSLSPLLNFYGVITAAYFFPIALITRYLLRYEIASMSSLKRCGVALIAIFSLAYFILTMKTGERLEAGAPDLFSIGQPLFYFPYMVALPLWLVVFLGTSRFYSNRLFSSMGRYSLFIYLLHQPIQVMCIKALHLLGFKDWLLVGMVSLFVSLTLSWGCSLFISRVRKLKSFLSPNSFEEWIHTVASIFLKRKDSEICL